MLYAIFGSPFALALLPAAFWLLVEQTTQVWNGVAVADGDTRRLIGSYVTRRLPVALSLVTALALDLWMVPAWTLGLAAGSLLSYVWQYRQQEPWARMMWPRRGSVHEKMPFDLGYWWGLVGQQLKDFDVAAVHAVSDTASGYYAFPARLVAPMNMVTLAAATSVFPRVARGGLTRRHLRLGLTLGLLPVTADRGHARPRRAAAPGRARRGVRRQRSRSSGSPASPRSCPAPARCSPTWSRATRPRPRACPATSR